MNERMYIPAVFSFYHCVNNHIKIVEWIEFLFNVLFQHVVIADSVDGFDEQSGFFFWKMEQIKNFPEGSVHFLNAITASGHGKHKAMVFKTGDVSLNGAFRRVDLSASPVIV